MDSSNKKGKVGGGLGQENNKARERMKEQKRANQFSRVKYDNCRVLDKDGNLSFICDEKKA